jgi:8-oxo-dGTP diphosphatase
LTASTDAAEARWFAVAELPRLAFDHSQIVQVALDRLRGKLEYSNIVYALLPAQFRLSELQKVYETILDTKLDKRNFRKKILSLDLVEATPQVDRSGAHRPAQLFRFKQNEVLFLK